LIDFFQFFGSQPYGKESLRRNIDFHLDEGLKLKVLINGVKLMEEKIGSKPKCPDKTILGFL
jgi:hypothetical protein